jgi:hypothetical protein
MKIHPPAEWNILCQSVFSSPLDLSRQIIPKTLLANSAAPIKSPNPTRNSFYVISLHLHFEAITASFNLSSMFFLQSLNNSWRKILLMMSLLFSISAPETLKAILEFFWFSRVASAGSWSMKSMTF